MPEIFGENDDMQFWENMGQEAAPEEGTSAVQEEATSEEDTASEKPRDEKGRFTAEQPEAAEQEKAEEPVAEEPEGEPEAPPDLDQLRSEIATLEKRLVDKDEFIGRQSTEVGELRQQLEARLAGLEQRAAQPQISDVDEFIDENPAQAAQHFYQQGDQHNLVRALEAWEDVSPGTASLWAENIRLRQEFEQRLAGIEGATAPMHEEALRQQQARALNELKEQHPDFDNYINDMDEIAPEYPEVLQVLESGQPEAMGKALKALYDIARGRKTDTLNTAAKDLTRKQVEEEKRVREEAAVASATSSVTEEKPSGAADLIGKEWEALEAPYKGGWNI